MTARAEEGSGRSGRGRRIAVWGSAALLMLVPAVASRLSDGMMWDAADFILAGALLLAGCGLWELAMRKSGSRVYSAAVGAAVGTAFLLFLVDGAVGLLGNEDDPVNLIFPAVIAVALGGSVIARFEPLAMARAMTVTAGAQVVAGAIGLILVPDLRGFVAATMLFAPSWLLSAWLFRKAAGAPARTGSQARLP